jgi:DNA-binding GntR family transcriptional regulator
LGRILPQNKEGTSLDNSISFTKRDLRGYSLRSKIYATIRDDIIDGRYTAGENLVELKLAEEYGVSRTPIREALLQLEREGLVEYKPNRGIVVIGISRQDIQDIYTIRELIEGLAAFWAAERATPQELKQLNETVDMIEFYTSKGDLEQITILDTMFHNQILDASKSRPLKQALGCFNYHVQQARLASLQREGRIEKSFGEHAMILEALKKRDPVGARKAMNNHISNVNYILPDTD